LILKTKSCQAFLELEYEQSAVDMVNYYNSLPSPFQLHGRTIYVQYSSHKQLKTESQADTGHLIQFVDNGLPSGTILHINIENMTYPVSMDTIANIFKKHGSIQKVVTFTKNNVFQALVEYGSSNAAKYARQVLHGKNIYNGCCQLQIEFSKLTELNIKYNNERGWDFTNPTLPSGPNQMMEASHTPPGQGQAGLPNNALIASRGATGTGMSILGEPPINAGKTSMFDSGPQGQDNYGMMSSYGGAAAAAPGMGLMGGGPMRGGGGCVLIVSNLDESRVTPDVLFTLFGVYGDVLRIKILYNKKDTALIQMTEPWMAQISRQYLDNIPLFGKPMNVSPSKNEHVQRTKDDRTEGAELTKDYTGSPLHRFKKPGSKNSTNIFEPSSTLHISNLGEGATEAEIQAPFREHGNVVLFKFFQDNRKMAHIQMASLEEAVQALIYVHNRDMRGMHLRVSFSKPPNSVHPKNYNL
jgi:hnRNP-L/PTB/hephaestus splicing factor